MNILTFESKEIEFDKIRISDYRARHLKEVLKVSKGQKVRVGVIGKGLGTAIVELIDEQGVSLKISDLSEQKNILNINLVLALPRPQTLKKVLELVGCYSIASLTLIDASKVEKSYFQSSILKEEQLKKHLLLGMQQGMHSAMPEVRIEKKLSNFLENLSDKSALRIIAEPNSEELISNVKLDVNETTILAIGPEGGWADQEVDSFLCKGFKPIKLSNSVLRVENAVSAALSQYELTFGMK